MDRHDSLRGEHRHSTEWRDWIQTVVGQVVDFASTDSRMAVSWLSICPAWISTLLLFLLEQRRWPSTWIVQMIVLAPAQRLNWTGRSSSACRIRGRVRPARRVGRSPCFPFQHCERHGSPRRKVVFSPLLCPFSLSSSLSWPTRSTRIFGHRIHKPIITFTCIVSGCMSVYIPLHRTASDSGDSVKY